MVCFNCLLMTYMFYKLTIILERLSRFFNNNYKLKTDLQLYKCIDSR